MIIYFHNKIKEGGAKGKKIFLIILKHINYIFQRMLYF